VIIIKRKKLLLALGLFLISFVLTGCFLFNSAPVIESDPTTTAKEGAVYTYDVEATDPNGDTLTYSLTTSPTDMTINSTTGLITWTPTEIQIGEHEVEIEVSDGIKSVTQSFTIAVEDALLDSIVVLPSSVQIAAGSSKTIDSVTAHYDNGTEADIALAACTYDSNNTKITVTNGIINVSLSCSATTAIITVSYAEGGLTKSDTVNVSVPSSGG